MDSIFVKGMIIGIVVSISFGPVVFTTIQKTINNGKVRGLIAGLGVAIADTIYSIVAAYSVSSASQIINNFQVPIRSIGAIILLIVGIKIIIKKPSLTSDEPKRNLHPACDDFFSSFFLALSSPQTVLVFALLFTTFNIIPEETNSLQLIKLYFGVFVGTSMWWSFMVSSISIFLDKLCLNNLPWINKIIGSSVIFFSIILALSIWVKI